ncbi:hypothetical protein TWF192_008184 [Orbilia oligospora]|uniref:Uncharacterized protein n=1 Tax=Orbilia oligospora TaxID=2813651 RepID=A0A6G1MMB6_ORBOL|nr:hypothetical protein TWF191_002507 [Orbilia oligospora]KAF3261726.1 hypothetical protein TWF192_008184 [Orbilia oligospora]
MASNNTTTLPAGNESPTSLGHEIPAQSPDLEPLQLPNPQSPANIPTTVQTLRRIFQDNSLSHEEQDAFAESILAIIRKLPSNPRTYQPIDFEEELENIILEWVDRAMMEPQAGISSIRDDWSGQQGGIRMEIPTANGADENKDNEVVEVSEREMEEDDEYEEGEGNEEDGDFDDDEENTVSENNDLEEGEGEGEGEEGGGESESSSIEDHFLIREYPEMQVELAWHQALSRDILPEHFALFKHCITERIRCCSGDEKEVLYEILTESQIAWLTEPIPENSRIKIPEKEQVWVVIWSVLKFARLLLRAGGGVIQDNTRINEYVAIIVGVWWLVCGEPFEYISKAQRGGPEVYMGAEGWTMSEEPWADMVLSESLGGSFEEVRERAKARKEAGRATEGGEADPTKPSHTEADPDIMSAREDLIRGILEEALMSTTRGLSVWSESVEPQWQRSQAGKPRAGAEE